MAETDGASAERAVVLTRTAKEPPPWFTALALVGGAVFMSVAVVFGLAAVWAEQADARPAPGVSTPAQTQTGTTAAAPEVPSPKSCDNCEFVGTVCKGEACVLDPDARWRVSPWTVAVSGKFFRVKFARLGVCIKNAPSDDWQCTKLQRVTLNGTKGSIVIPEQSRSIELSSFELQSRGFWVQVLEGDSVVYGPVLRTRPGLIPGKTLFDGGFVLGADGFVNRLGFRFEPVDTETE